MKKGLLIVSFGTSHEETRKKTIRAIENEFSRACPDFVFGRAFTSGMIRRKLLHTTGERIASVTEAVEEMIAQGVTDLYVQPTHVIDGIENEQMKADVLAFRDKLQKIAFGEPLLASLEDQRRILNILHKSWPLDSREALLLMGHGSSHPANRVYASLNTLCQELGYSNMYIGTVEASPTLDDMLEQITSGGYSHLHLAPLMIVAGDHAANDMAGDDTDSWASQCREAGYTVTCHLKGLGEYPEVRRLLLEHLQKEL